MRKLSLLLCLVFPVLLSAQDRIHLTLFGGFANYQGDLQDRTFTLDESNGAFGIGVKYDLTSRIAIRSSLNYGSIQGDDKVNNLTLQARNLSFQTKIFELNLLGEYTFFDLNENRFSPYVFGGIAAFRFNPYAYDSSGNKHFLKPLSTEGQGLTAYPDRKPYKLTQFAVPFGAGIKYRITENAVIGYEIGLRKTFFDYLDDVSTTYVDPAALALERGTKAVEMSYRGGEVKNGNPVYPPSGTVRGGSKNKDWYYFSGITLAVSINAKSWFSGGGRTRKGSTDCPKVL